MKRVWSQEVDEILSVGIPLFENGINNWALSREQALGALDRLQNLGVPVLGGDVCTNNSDNFIYPNADNWSCEPLPGETDLLFAQRSTAESKRYIQNYINQNIDSAFFVIVPDV